MSSLKSLKAFMKGSGETRARERRSNVLVVGAGKGGVGTSTLTLLLGRAAARQGVRVLVVEADEHFATLPLLAGVTGPMPGLGLIGPDGPDPEELVSTLEPGLDLIPGGGGDQDATLASGTGRRRAMLRRVTTLYERYPLVLVDGGARLESVTAAVAQGAGRLLAVATPDRIALAGAYALFKVAVARFPDLSVELVLNRASAEEARAAGQVAEHAAAHFLACELSVAGALPFDADLERSVASARGLLSLADAAPAAAAASELASGLVARLLGGGADDSPVLRLAATGS